MWGRRPAPLIIAWSFPHEACRQEVISEVNNRAMPATKEKGKCAMGFTARELNLGSGGWE